MSEDEHRVGKLIPVEIQGDLENTARIILEENDQKKSYDTHLEELMDWGYDKYVITKDAIFDILPRINS